MEHREARGGTLVLGGGFAGCYVARFLGRRGAAAVSPENSMTYTPLLPEAGAGTLEPRHVVVPIRQMCPHSELVLGFKDLADTIALRNRLLQQLERASTTRTRPSSSSSAPGTPGSRRSAS